MVSRRDDRRTRFRELIEASRARRLARDAEAEQERLRTPTLPAGQSPDIPPGLIPEPTNQLPGNPEFGSFFGSGLLEGAAGGGLRGLEQLQRGVETFGGSALNLQTAFTPGEQKFEEMLKQVREERKAAGKKTGEGFGGRFNIGAQAQERAEAFRRTDLPSVSLDLIPGKGINLPGDATLNKVDFGVKGAIELLPEVALALVTGGASSVRGAVGNVAKELTGADILVGGVRTSRKTANAIKAAREVSAVRKAANQYWTKPATVSEVATRLQDVTSEKGRQLLESVPSRYRGLVHEAAATVSRTKLTNPKDLYEVNLIAHMINNSRNSSKVSEGMGRLLAATVQFRKSGTDLKKLYIGDEANGIPVEAGLFRVKDVNPKFADFTSEDLGVLIKANRESGFINKAADIAEIEAELAARTGGERTVFLSEFLETIFKGEDLSPDNAVLGPRLTPTMEVFDPEFNQFRKLNDQELEFIRILQDAMTAQGDLLREAGLLKSSDIIGDGGELYFRRLLKTVGNAQDQKYGRARRGIGGQSSVLRKRTLTEEELVGRVKEQGYLFESDPMAILEESGQQVYKAINDKQLIDGLKRVAKKNPERIRVPIDERVANQARSALTRAGKGQVLKPKTIENIAKRLDDDSLIPAFQEILKIDDEALKAQRIAEAKVVVENIIANDRRAKVGEYVIAGEKVAHTQLQQFFFASKAEAKKAENLLNTTDPNLRRVAEGLGGIGDVSRVLRTGFDFGFWMIQGIPFLGRSAALAVTNPKQGMKMYADYLQSFVIAGRAMGDPEFARTVIAKSFDRDLVNEMLENGMQMSRHATDAFRGTDVVQDLFNRVPVVGGKLAGLTRSFERGFVTPGDFLRASYYRDMRSIAIRAGNGDPALISRNLRDLAASGNKMTGALSSAELGIAPTQQALERGLFFFSARYTRSSLALIHDAFTGGLQGAEARRTLFGMAGLGVAGYVAFAEAMGQEVVLDPTDSNFMTVDINGDRIGIGGFHTSFVKLLARTGGQLTDPNGLGEFANVRENAIFRWIRGRSAPVGGYGWDLALGETFLGEPLESPVAWSKHIGKNSLPIWAEAAAFSDPTRAGPAGLVAEAAGLRTRPASLSEVREDLRNNRSQAAFNKDWDDLNGLQKDTLEADNQELRDANLAVNKTRSVRGRSIDGRIEEWNQERRRLESDWVDRVALGDEYLKSGVIDPVEFLNVYLTPANAQRRQDMAHLFNREEGARWVDVMDYFRNSPFGGPELPEDIAYVEYITDVLNNENFADPVLGFDFDAKDEAEQEFRLKWGEEVFAYVKGRTGLGRESIGYRVPDVVAEYWNNRERFRYYWDGTEKSVINARSDAAISSILWENYKDADLNTKHLMTTPGNPQYRPAIKEISNMISKVKKVLRTQNRELDAWLFRWNISGVDTLQHPDNQGEDVRLLLRDGKSDFARVMDNLRKFQIDTI